jgi:hypothetical protein
LSLFIKDNPITQNVNGIDQLLNLIDENGGDLRPEEVFDGKFFVKYTHDRVKQIISKQGLGFKNFLDLRRVTYPKGSYSLDFMYGEENPTKFWFKLMVPLDYFSEITLRKKHLNSLLSFIRVLASEFCPSYGFCHPTTDLMFEMGQLKAHSNPPIELRDIYWLNIFGPDLLKYLGKERVLAAPITRAEQLKCNEDDLLLFLIQETPFNISSKKSRVNQAQILTRILDAKKFGDVLTQLQERSNILNSEKSGWGGEIADLLKIILDNISEEDRENELKKFNRYRPPTPTEWVPITNLKMSNVSDINKEIDTYKFGAEKLIALLHQSIPAIVQNKPNSLQCIDYYFWRLNYPARFKTKDIENDLIQSIGGYIGDLLIRYMNGRWVPRINKYETQVIVGKRAWLPFLRAKKYMQTQQSIIDYSLTQFYRVISNMNKTTHNL